MARPAAKAGALAYTVSRQRLEPSLTTSAGKGWSPRLHRQQAKAGAFAYTVSRQRLEPSLTPSAGKGWSLRLHRQQAKAGALAYTVSRQRLEPSLTEIKTAQIFCCLYLFGTRADCLCVFVPPASDSGAGQLQFRQHFRSSSECRVIGRVPVPDVHIRGKSPQAEPGDKPARPPRLL